jgi:hypothetical protein
MSLAEAVAWLDNEAHRIIRASAREMKNGTTAFPPQAGIGYEAFWLRDYEYTLEGSADSYSEKEMLDACRLFLRSLRADGAGVECVKFDGTPVYMPGYGSMGQNPVADGSQFTVGVAWHTYQKIGNAGLLREMLDPLVKTMRSAPRNSETRLVHIDPGLPWDRCPYGFTDTIRKKGDELFCSLLFVQACRQLSGLLLAGKRAAESREWAKEGELCAKNIRKIFWDPRAKLFRAATAQCCEHDIWGSAFAVWLGVADKPQSAAVATCFKTNYAAIVQHGQVRHLPGGEYWQEGCARDTYQNGAYWATPTGWFVYTLDLVDPALADRTVADMVCHFQQHGACEWIFGETRHLPHYLASASLPLAGIRNMLERRQAGGSSGKAGKKTGGGT